MKGVAEAKEDSEFFIAWLREDNEGQPSMSFEAAREVYKYRVFRDDYHSSAEPVTETMTYQEAKRKLKEIILLTKGSEYE